MKKFFLSLVLAGFVSQAAAQTETSEERFGVWFPFQLLPNLSLYSSSPLSGFGFEWEFTPVLYTFGMNKQISPWYAFIVEPTARFTGSIELVVAGQLFTTKMGRSYFAASGHLMGTIPLVERGEHLTLNLGIGAYRIADQTRIFKVAGISTLFGMVHFNLKHGENPTTWIISLEFRIF